MIIGCHKALNAEAGRRIELSYIKLGIKDLQNCSTSVILITAFLGKI